VSGPGPLECFGEFAAVHDGHDDVGEQGVDDAVVAFGDGEGFLAVGGGEDVVASAGEDAGDDLPQAVFVLGDQDGLACGGGRGGDLLGRRRRAGGGGKVDVMVVPRPGAESMVSSPPACLMTP
jgi:hypothetical protein